MNAKPAAFVNPKLRQLRDSWQRSRTLTLPSLRDGPLPLPLRGRGAPRRTLLTMLRAHSIAPAGQWPLAQARGTVTLAYEDRYRRRVRLSTDAGLPVLLDLPQATVLGEGDALALDGGGFVAVKAASETLVEITAATPEQLARIAWHIGNRHVPAEIHAQRILTRDDHVIVAMVEGLGAMVRRIEAPFTPEGGAYAGNPDDHV